MADVARTRFATVLILAVLFVSGVLVGMAVDRGMESAEAPSGAAAAPEAEGAEDRGRDDDDDDRRRRRRPMYEQVGLNEVQEERIDSIVRHYREEMEVERREARQEWESRWRELVLETREAIKSVMDRDQALRYDSLLAAADQRGRNDERRDDEDRNDEGR